MGKIANSFLTGTSGRVGNVVVVNRGTQQIIRQRPQKASKPRTPKQLLIKQRLQIITLFIEPKPHVQIYNTSCQYLFHFKTTPSYLDSFQTTKHHVPFQIPRSTINTDEVPTYNHQSPYTKSYLTNI